MAVCSSSSLSVFSVNSVPKTSSKNSDINLKLNKASYNVGLYGKSSGRSGLTKLNAGGKLNLIEPDLNEDPVDRWATFGVSPEDFKYGEYDGHHTYFETDERGSFWGAIADDVRATEPPSGFQGFISWAFLPAVAAGMYFNVPGEYLFIGAAVFVTIFTIFELDKPDKPHNFEPEIYNMERGARDKLINDYNTMSIWEFNEKYGHLWDFTVKVEETTKR
ncbi:photosynthetic NDH subunit of subcomplex B 5, chloroplastic [Pistacia vera]|uniref:photosynthetic NDH subunit of subcomplex B 5, chloroplastic-like n=1 Tax=Pistacia vera TaxID=55513 RepID=UPI001262D25E|nr:photosynthetic NDH subunit of subcomplex B 5, chloroplastic-like [Pistacia vera]XP_031272445.1 photosynthetic NDH subunit of subcomplex B 5, chloroplastic [Pistacia vera]